MSLNTTTGVISGTPSSAGNTTFSVTATDIDGFVGTPKSFTLAVFGFPASLPSATVGQAGSVKFEFSKTKAHEKLL